MKLIYHIIFFTFILSTCHSNAQLDSVPKHETFTINSKHVGEPRIINVWTPPEYRTNIEPLPVLYMLDGGIKEDFSHVANTLADLIKAGKISPVILVGIENTQRRRDLTGQTTVKKDKKIAPVVGKSEEFRAFINDELFEEINKRYKITNRKGIIGESLAGLFVTETLLLKPHMFDFYIAFDPSLWWNNKHLVKTANEPLDKFPTSKKTFWFAGSATKDIYKPATKLAGILKSKNIINLSWKYSPEPKETHGTIFRATKEKAIIWTLGN